MQLVDHAAHTLCLAFLFSPGPYPIARSVYALEPLQWYVGLTSYFYVTTGPWPSRSPWFSSGPPLDALTSMEVSNLFRHTSAT